MCVYNFGSYGLLATRSRVRLATLRQVQKWIKPGKGSRDHLTHDDNWIDIGGWKVENPFENLDINRYDGTYCHPLVDSRDLVDSFWHMMHNNFLRVSVPWKLYTTFWSENLFRRAEQIFRGYWIRITRNARSGKVGSRHCYLHRRPSHEMDKIVYEYDRKQFHRLVYVALPRVIFNTLFNIIRVGRSRYVL